MTVPTDDPILAAGGVVLRRGRSGATEILLVHRPRHADWSLPKGKVEDGEDLAETALREVEEETGQRCRLGERIAETSYAVGPRPKKVVFFLMEALGGPFAPSDEVDRIAWLEPGAARRRLSHDTERAVLDRAAAVLGGR